MKTCTLLALFLAVGVASTKQWSGEHGRDATVAAEGLALAPVALGFASPVADASDQTTRAGTRKRAPWAAAGFDRRPLHRDQLQWLTAEWSRTPDKWVRLLQGERVHEDAPFAEQQHEFTTSFDVLGAWGAYWRDLLVLGRARDGGHVLEWWSLTWPAGTQIPYVPRSAAPLGTAVVTPLPVSTLVGPGPYVPLAQRVGGPAVQRVELYRGPALGSRYSAVVDPDGRFAVLLARNAEQRNQAASSAVLLRVPFSTEAGVEVLLSSEGTPELNAAQSLMLFDHLELGRVYHMPLFPHPKSYLLALDQTNDGLLDGVLALSHQEGQQVGVFDQYIHDY